MLKDKVRVGRNVERPLGNIRRRKMYLDIRQGLLNGDYVLSQKTVEVIGYGQINLRQRGLAVFRNGENTL